MANLKCGEIRVKQVAGEKLKVVFRTVLDLQLRGIVSLLLAVDKYLDAGLGYSGQTP